MTEPEGLKRWKARRRQYIGPVREWEQGREYPLTNEHALYAGAVLGIALRHGLTVAPVVDDEGNYTDRLTIELDGVTLELVVPPPPPGWRIADWIEAEAGRDAR